MDARGTVRFAREPGTDGVRTVTARDVRPDFARHAHQSWIIGLALRGGRRMEVSGARRDVPEGGIFVIPPDTPHACALLGPPPHAHRAVCLPDRTLRAMVRQGPAGRSGHAAMLLGRYFALVDADAADADRREALSRALRAVPGLAELAGDHGDELETRNRRVEVERAARYLAGNARDNPSLDEAARHAGLSPSHLHRLFVARFGLPPHAFVIRERLRLALMALEAGESPAGAAAWAGFVDQSHFTRHFRRAVGVTPGRFAASTPLADGPPDPWA